MTDKKKIRMLFSLDIQNICFAMCKIYVNIIKNYLTDILDTNEILRLIESVLSPKKEPFKLWLAQMGNELL